MALGSATMRSGRWWARLEAADSSIIMALRVVASVKQGHARRGQRNLEKFGTLTLLSNNFGKTAILVELWW